MKLWSLHDPCFSLIEGTVIHSKSHFYTSVIGVRDAYHKLWRKIGQLDGQIVWCYTIGDHIRRTGIPKRLWCLDLPDNQVLCSIDDIAWNKIMGQPEFWMPDELKHEWNRQPQTGDWWDELIIPDKANRFLWSALIRHPVPEHFVTGRVDWQAGQR
jgi:hypothetical protein